MDSNKNKEKDVCGVSVIPYSTSTISIMDELPSSLPADYCRDYLPPGVVEKLEAAAFRQLCRHLQERSDEVQNMDLMALSGFCRNCLAKVCYEMESLAS